MLSNGQYWRTVCNMHNINNRYCCRLARYPMHIAHALYLKTECNFLLNRNPQGPIKIQTKMFLAFIWKIDDDNDVNNNRIDVLLRLQSVWNIFKWDRIWIIHHLSIQLETVTRCFVICIVAVFVIDDVQHRDFIVSHLSLPTSHFELYSFPWKEKNKTKISLNKKSAVARHFDQ